MRFIRRLLILLLPFAALAGSDTEIKFLQKPTKWVPVYGFKHPTSKAYMDSNSVSRRVSESGADYGTAGLLLVSNEPVPMPFLGKTIMVKSIVKHLVMDCKGGILAPAVDFYFAVDRPTRQDKPIAVMKYDNLSGVEVVSKSSLIYHTLCPIYI